MTNVIMLSRLFYPHIGGVEKHVLEISKILAKKKFKITVITEKFSEILEDEEDLNNISVYRINYPKIKLIGLVKIWISLLSLIDLFKKAEIVHVHDVFIWYLPIRILLPKKKVYTTFHGWEGVYPIPKVNIIIKKLSNMLSHKSICVGKYIEDFYGIKCSSVIYGAVKEVNGPFKKKKGQVVYLGRLEKDTGVEELLHKKWKGKEIIFCGDGKLANKCLKYGKVLGFVNNPIKYLKKAEYCFASGYLSALEAASCRCKLKIGWDNKLKRNYWIDSPFYKFIKEKDWEGLHRWSQTQTWNNLVSEYLKLWNKV